MAPDIYDIGWWIEATDEEIYGPVSRTSLRVFMTDGTVSPNSLVRHCTQTEFRPVADQPGMTDGLNFGPNALVTGDRLTEAWPRKNRDRLALAEGELPCPWHNRPAVLFCVRCQAPYCNKCRARPLRRQFFVCRRCQKNVYNSRWGAYILDNLLFGGIPAWTFAGLTVAGVLEPVTGQILTNLAAFGGTVVSFFRDALFGGAGPGKRVAGLRVVLTADGVTPVTYGKAFLRNLSLMIPFFNLVDISVPYRDPLGRRYGDRWAGTRVIETARKLEKVRAKVAKRLAKKGVEIPQVVEITAQQYARIAD